MNEPTIFSFSDSYARTLDLGKPWPKATTTTPGQMESAKYLLGDGNTKLRMGVWECTAGCFAVHRMTTEICHLLTGRVTIRSADGAEASFGPGDNFTLPSGFRGEWHIHETVRKVFIVHDEKCEPQ